MDITAEAPEARASAPWTEAELRRHSFAAMLLDREIRWVGSVRRWLSDPHVLARAEEDPEAALRLAECRRWLEGAVVHEGIHGDGSLLDRLHPHWVGNLEPVLRRVEAMLRGQGRWPHGDATYMPGGAA